MEINLRKIYYETRKLSNTWANPIKKDLKYFGLYLDELVKADFKTFASFAFLGGEINLKRKKKISHIILAKLQNYHFKWNISKYTNKNKIWIIGSLRQSLPILKELRKNPNNIIIRAGENVGNGLFNKYVDFYVTFSEFFDYKINKKLKKAKKIFEYKWDCIKKNKEFKKKLFYKKPLFDLLEFHLESLFYDRFISLIKYIELMKLLKSKVDIVVSHNDLLPFEKTIFQTAKKLNIPSLVILHGFLTDKIIKRGSDWIPFSADKMTLFSEHQKKIILKFYKKKILPDRLVVTGYPLFDKYFNDKPTPKNEIYEKYNIPKNKKIILYAIDGYYDVKKIISFRSITQENIDKEYFELFKIFKEFSNLHLLIKLHPNFLDIRSIEKIAKKLDFENYTITKSFDNHGLFNASTAVITLASTMGLESLFHKKPTIIFGLNSDLNNTGYNKFNAVYLASKKGDLKKILIRILKNPDEKLNNMKKFVSKYYSKNDGKASKRVTDLIEDMIKGKIL